MDALDLIAKIKMDLSEYEEGLDKAQSKASKSASGISGAFGKVASGVGTAMSAAVKVTAAAVTTAATAVTALTTMAVKSYAEFEQLEGGTELMFGEAADFIMEKSEEAYKTVQMSQNEYLTQVNGFATGLKTALGGNEQAAAELADKIITAEADVVAATGNTQEAVQNAFNGIMKSNYTMLDNLQIGITPTKEGFQEVIDKVNEWNAANGEATNYVIDNLADCEAALVDYIEMVGMSGYAQREASETITGSLSSMKSAWSNLLTGIANDEADLDSLMQGLIDTIVGYTDESGTEVKGFLDNIIPVVETSLSSIGTLIEKLIPEALALIPTLITDVLPSITNAAITLAQGLVTSLKDNMGSITDVATLLIDAFIQLLPEIVSLGGQIIESLGSAIMDNLDTLIDAAGQILEMIITGIISNVGKLQAACAQIEVSIMNYLTENASMLIQSAILIIETLGNGFLENLPMLIDAGIQLTMAIFNGLLEALPELLNYLPEVVTQVADIMIENTPVILDAATTMFLALVECLPDILIALTQAISEILTSLVDILTGEGSSEIGEAALMCFMEIAAAIPEILGAVIGATMSILQSIYDAIAQYGAQMLTAGTELMMEVGNGLTEAGSEVLTKVVETVTGWVDAVKNTVNDWVSAGKSLVEGLWSGFTGTFESLKSKVSEKLNGLTSMVKSAKVYDINSPSKVFAKIGSSLVEGLEKGWDDDIDDAKKSMANSAKFDTNAFNSTLGFNNTSVGTGTPTNISLYTTNTLDGQIIGESTYQFTVDKINNQQRALAVAQGGYY